MSDVILHVENLKKSYNQGSGELEILKGLNFSVTEGEASSIVGSSGSGKSTLLHLIGTLDSVTSGKILFRGEDLAQRTEAELSEFRLTKLGFVFQFHHLLAEFSAIENIMLPARLAGKSAKDARARAEELLRIMGLTSRSSHFPNQLSGGELQRVSIARALVNEPQLLLADEPTGNLDSHNATAVQDLLFELQKKTGVTMLVVTHDIRFANRFSRTLRLQDGVWAK